MTDNKHSKEKKQEFFRMNEHTYAVKPFDCTHVPY